MRIVFFAHAHRVHEDAWPGQRFHRARTAHRTPSFRPRQMAGTRRSSQRHRLRSGAGHASRRGSVLPTSSTASSMPTAGKSSNAATARAVVAALLHRRGRSHANALTMESVGGMLHARVLRRRAGSGRHGRAQFRSQVTAVRCAGPRGELRAALRRREHRIRGGIASAIRTRCCVSKRSKARRWRRIGRALQHQPAISAAGQCRLHADHGQRAHPAAGL